MKSCHFYRIAHCSSKNSTTSASFSMTFHDLCYFPWLSRPAKLVFLNSITFHDQGAPWIASVEIFYRPDALPVTQPTVSKYLLQVQLTRTNRDFIRQLTIHYLLCRLSPILAPLHAKLYQCTYITSHHFIVNIRTCNAYCYVGWLAVWCSGNALVSINAVALHRARLVLGWVTAFGQVNCLIT